MASVKLKVRESMVNGKEGRLFIQIIHRREIKVIPTKIKLFTHEWDNQLQHVIPDAQNIWRICYLYEIEKEIRLIQKAINDIISKLSKRGTYTTAEVVGLYTGKNMEIMLSPFMDKKIQELKDAGKENTAYKYKITFRVFLKFRNGIDIPLNQLGKPVLKEFQNYLKSKRIAMNTVSFYMRILRATYNKAIQEELISQQNPFTEVYTGIAKTEKRAVDEKIIRELQSVSLNDELAYARDLFLFSFYTRGMSFIDMANLKKSDCEQGVIHYKRSKTGQQLSIAIEPCTNLIIKRYTMLNSGSEYLLPITYSHRRIIKYESALRVQNLRLKIISDILNLETPLTSYVARHTWASVARRKGISIQIISESMGHTSENTTRIYLSSLDQNIIDKANKIVIGRTE